MQAITPCLTSVILIIALAGFGNARRLSSISGRAPVPAPKMTPVDNTIYNLTYFDVKGRAEGIRLMLAAAGMADTFIDTRISDDDWTNLKSSTGFGQLPILQFDGQTLTQSLAIARFLGKKLGFEPQDPLMAARVDELAQTLADTFEEYSTYVNAVSESKPGAPEMANILWDEIFPRSMGIFNNLLTRTPGPFVTGDKPSWADFMLANALELFYENVPVVAPLRWTTWHSQYLVRTSIFALPGVAEYLNTRPVSKF